MNAGAEPKRSAAARASASSHGVGLAETLALARVLGHEAMHPTVFAVELAAIDVGADLSPPLAHALPQLAKRLLDLVSLAQTRATATAGLQPRTLCEP